MKTQVIRLEPHDDAISIRDKITWGQTGRILLVWPDKGRLVLRYSLDLTLLLRYCTHQGAQMALVTDDAAVIPAARDLGIPVFKTPRAAQNTRWRGGRYRRLRARPTAPNPDLEEWHTRQQAVRRAARRIADHPAMRLAFFGLAVLALLAAAAMLAPAARIDLIPQTQTQTVSLVVSASSSAEEVSLSGVTPARPVSVIVEDQAAITPTGTLLVPASQAEGEVRFTNRTDRAITIPPGTIVTTSGDAFTATIRYQTTLTGDVSPAPGSMVILPVRALNPGAASNVAARRLTVIEGALRFDLEALNLIAIRNGSDRPAPAPTEADRRRLYEQLEASLQSDALAQIRATIALTDVLLETTPTLARSIEVIYTPAEAQPAGQLSLSLRLEYQILVAAGEDMARLAGMVLDAGLPEGFEPLPETEKYTLTSAPEAGADGVLRWKMRAERTLKAQVDVADAIAYAQGQPRLQAVQRLKAVLPVASAPLVSLNPAWWPRLPWAPFRIEVVVH